MRHDDAHDHDDGELFEPERYELLERPVYRFGVGRRGFLRGIGGGLFVGALVTGKTANATGPAARGSDASGSPSRQESLSAWMHIAEDETISVYSGRIEMGQGIRTSVRSTHRRRASRSHRKHHSCTR